MHCDDSDSLYAVFSQVIRFHYYRMHTMLEKLSVYPGQPPLLYKLGKQDGQSQRELADKLHVKPATITVMLKRAEKAGLVERRPDPEDQRVMRVYLTEKGKKLDIQVKEIMKSMERELFNNFTVEEQLLLRRLMMQMRDNLKKLCEENLDV